MSTPRGLRVIRQLLSRLYGLCGTVLDIRAILRYSHGEGF